MSISAAGGVSASKWRDDVEEPQTSQKTPPHDFDFQGAAYTRAVVPHGMIAASSSRAAIASDITAIESKLHDIQRDLSTPAMRELFNKTGKVTWLAQKIELKLAAAIGLIALFKDKGVVALLGGASALGSLAGAIDDITALPQQVREAFGAAHAAHPDAVQLERDLRDLGGAMAKLGTDLKAAAGF